MRKPVFEVTGDAICTLCDEKATLEWIEKKLSEKRGLNPEPHLKKLERFFLTASCGDHVTIGEGKLVMNVTKASRT